MNTQQKHDLNKWFVVVNPNAGNRKIKRDWGKIETLLQKAELDFEFTFTEHVLHAIDITTAAIKKGYRKFISVGGDGTFNEVVNGFFGQTNVNVSEFIIGLIPVGTGNDWGRMFGIPTGYEKSIEIIAQKKAFVQDVGKISYFENQKQRIRYFVNIAGMGFDALVAQKTNKQKAEGKGNSMAYFFNLFTSVFEYKPGIAEIHIDKKKYNFNTFSMSVGICRYNGGGIKQLPHAIADDGLLDMTVIKKMGLGTLFAQIKNLYSGSFVKHPKVATFTATNVKIHSKKKNFMMEADGESLGSAPFEVSIIPTILRVIINTKP